ncbi:hypothetical protein [Deinococcus aquaedulcis]|uniref:hypothetical protein n=1 Tax=Deinococcus aquaedulcis TaxID=2840455 RepID=UPI001C83A847|nr:hypothetical protein [Deinococcus aquaedulcis]
MIRLDAKHYHTLTFSPDEPVLAMILDQDARRFVVGVTAAFAGPDVMLEGVRLELSTWSTLRLQEHVQDRGCVTVEYLHDELAEICDFEMHDGEIRVSGFLRQAHGYVDLILQNPKMAVEYVAQREVRSREHKP